MFCKSSNYTKHAVHFTAVIHIYTVYKSHRGSRKSCDLSVGPLPLRILIPLPRETRRCTVQRQCPEVVASSSPSSSFQTVWSRFSIRFNIFSHYSLSRSLPHPLPPVYGLLFRGVAMVKKLIQNWYKMTLCFSIYNIKVHTRFHKYSQDVNACNCAKYLYCIFISTILWNWSSRNGLPLYILREDMEERVSSSQPMSPL